VELVLQHVWDCFELGADHGHSFLKRPCASAKRCVEFEFLLGLNSIITGMGWKSGLVTWIFGFGSCNFSQNSSDWSKNNKFSQPSTVQRVTHRQIRSCALGARQPLIVEEFGTQEPVAHEPFIRCCCFYKWIRYDTLNSHKHETTIMIMSELLYLFK